MPDDIDLQGTTWAGNRRAQREIFRALAFREKAERLEEMGELIAVLRRAPERGGSDGAASRVGSAD
jgi:hypothetical protein